MPTYEYRCPDGHEFELFQRITDPPEASCPRCGKAAERRLSAGAGLLFKGSGFYITDYRSEGYRKAAEAEKGGTGSGGKEKGGAPESGGSGSGETRPAPGKSRSEGQATGDTGTD